VPQLSVLPVPRPLEAKRSWSCDVPQWRHRQHAGQPAITPIRVALSGRPRGVGGGRPWLSYAAVEALPRVAKGI